MSDTNPITADDILDSRDIIARIEYLEGRLNDEDDPLDVDEREELDALTDLAQDGESVPDWHYGEALIRDDHFEDYARELAQDIGAIDRAASWPLSYIDWAAAADALKMDYADLTFMGYMYWARA